MKTGVSYNVFDGEELLEASIAAIREEVDYISVVYQIVSNFGRPANKSLVPLLSDLKEKKLVDKIVSYSPLLERGGHGNEISKRNIGLELSRHAACTHHMAMDTDEFYIEEEFSYMKRVMQEGNYSSGACKMTTYYKEPIYRLEPKESYYVPLFYKLSPTQQRYILAHPFPVLVDPARRMEAGKCKIFRRDEIEMHHMSYVRKNIRKKLSNSSACGNFKSIDALVHHYNGWKYPQPALWGGDPDTYRTIVKTPSLFNITVQ